MSALLAPANPHRIKATHRRRRKVASGRFVQRYYDAEIGRFLTPDPIETNPEDGTFFNRYWYADNNPSKNIDPDGRCTGSHITNKDDTCKSTGTVTTVDVTSSKKKGGVSGVTVPENIKIEAQGFKTSNDAAKDAGTRYGEEGVKSRREVQLGIVRISEGNWGHLTPGWGDVGATNVNPIALFNAYVNVGLAPMAWMHGHFDDVRNFSAVDFVSVFGQKARTAYLVNAQGEVRALNYNHLRKAMKNLSVGDRNLDGLQRVYEASGLPGDEL